MTGGAGAFKGKGIKPNPEKRAKRGRPAIPQEREILRALQGAPATGQAHWTVRSVAAQFGISAGKAHQLLKRVRAEGGGEGPEPLPEPTEPATPAAANAESSVTMADIAALAGVSKQTVSLVMRNAPGISAACRQKVLRIAAGQGYRPNPLSAAWMSDIRRKKRSFKGTVLMMLHDMDKPPEEYRGPESRPTMAIYYEAAQMRAGELGYRLDTLRYNKPGLSGERLNSILSTRGIHGLYIAGHTPFPEIDWQNYAVVCTRQPDIPIYSVMPDTAYNVHLACERMLQRKRGRIGLAIDSSFPASSNYYGALQAYLFAHRDLQSIPAFDCHPMETKDRFEQWLKKHKPDFVLMLWTGLPYCHLIEQHLRDAAHPAELVLLGIPKDRTDLTGIKLRRNAIGEAAINLLHELMANNRFGLLTDGARVLLIRGEWHEGACATSAPARR